MINEAILLAGGRGTRLQPVLPETPKVIAEIGGRPFITFILDQLQEAGIARVILATGYRGGQVRRALGESYRHMQLLYSEEPCLLGTGGAVRFALQTGCASSAQVMVLNGDSFIDTNLGTFYLWHCDRNDGPSLLLTTVPDAARFGTVTIAEDARITAFHEKRGSVEAGLINAGVYVFPRDWLMSLPGECALSLEREVLPKWLGQGVYGYSVNASFLDVGIPEALRQAECFFTRLGRIRSWAGAS